MSDAETLRGQQIAFGMRFALRHVVAGDNDAKVAHNVELRGGAVNPPCLGTGSERQRHGGGMQFIEQRAHAGQRFHLNDLPEATALLFA